MWMTVFWRGLQGKPEPDILFFLSRICSSTNFWSTYTQCVLYARFAYYIFRLKRKSIVSSNRIHAWQLHWGGSHKKRLLPVIKSRSRWWPYSATASSNHFKKDRYVNTHSNIGWPQQPPTEKISDTSEKLDFWWSIPQKGTSTGNFGTRDDPTIRFRKFLGEMRLLRSLRPPRLLRLLRSLRLQRF